MQEFRFSENPLAEARAQRPARMQVHSATQDRREFVGHVDEGQSRGASGHELDEDVHVALRSKIVPGDRAEDRESMDPVLPAELGDARAVDGDPDGQETAPGASLPHLGHGDANL
jgi:hypothetical protein